MILFMLNEKHSIKEFLVGCSKSLYIYIDSDAVDSGKKFLYLQFSFHLIDLMYCRACLGVLKTGLGSNPVSLFSGFYGSQYCVGLLRN